MSRPVAHRDPSLASARRDDGDAVDLAPITRDDAPILVNLCELYAHDFSEYVPLPLKPSGRFDLAIDERWWTDGDHFPFFIRWRGELSGFALVRRGSRVNPHERDLMDVAELFVVRGLRGRRVGAGAVHALWAMFPGSWEVRVRLANVPAQRFWRAVLASWSPGPVSIGRHTAQGVEWEVFRLTPPRL